MKVRHAISQHAAAFTSLDQPAPDGASSDPCIHELVSAQAARTPSAIAVVCGNAQLTYRELDARANRLAHGLIARGVGPDVFVAVCVERSIDMVIALLGVLKAGGAYLP